MGSADGDILLVVMFASNTGLIGLVFCVRQAWPFHTQRNFPGQPMRGAFNKQIKQPRRKNRCGEACNRNQIDKPQLCREMLHIQQKAGGAFTGGGDDLMDDIP